MSWRMTLLIAYVLPSLCLGQSVSALRAAKLLGGTSTVLAASQTTSSYEAVGQKAAASSAAASTSMGLSAAALSQAAAAASSQALAGVSSSTTSGSEVGILAQVIIAIGVLPIEVLIVAIVLGVHRLMHRRSTRALQTKSISRKPKRDTLLYLQPKAELEDEQRRRHELHGEHVVHEFDGADEIFQMPDERESLVLPLQGRRGVHEMPEGPHMRWEMPLQGRYEVMGDEYARELESPILSRKDSIRVNQAQELESPIRARNNSIVPVSARELESPVQASNESMIRGDDEDLTAPAEDPVTSVPEVDSGRSHFMLRQEQMLDIDRSSATDQQDTNEM